MPSKESHDYRVNPDFLLSFTSHLGVTTIFSDQPPPVCQRVKQVLRKIMAEVKASRNRGTGVAWSYRGAAYHSSKKANYD